MSRCEACASEKTCHPKDSSRFYRKDEKTPVIALLGQPNSGKSTIFNMMTGSHQHVGNWPGKTVDRKEGECRWNGQRMILADLPGSYSLSAGSDEEVITRDYITAGNADLVLVMADASQLRRSLYMLADFVGTNVPAVLVLNMMDVAKGQGVTVNTDELSRKLGIPVVPMSAIRKKDYRSLYETIQAALAQKNVIVGETMNSAEEKMAYIDALLDGVVTAQKRADQAFSKFDRLALSPVRGKLMAFGIILVIFLLAMLFAGVVGGIASAVLTSLSGVLRTGMEHISVHPLLISLICDVLVNVLYFALMMSFLWTWSPAGSDLLSSFPAPECGSLLPGLRSQGSGSGILIPLPQVMVCVFFCESFRCGKIRCRSGWYFGNFCFCCLCSHPSTGCRCSYHHGACQQDSQTALCPFLISSDIHTFKPPYIFFKT